MFLVGGFAVLAMAVEEVVKWGAVVNDIYGEPRGGLKKGMVAHSLSDSWLSYVAMSRALCMNYFAAADKSHRT